MGWWLLVLAGLPLLTIAIGLLLGDSLAAIDPVRFVVSQLVFGAVNVALVNLWQETAWSGVVQTRLERRHTRSRRGPAVHHIATSIGGLPSPRGAT